MSPETSRNYLLMSLVLQIHNSLLNRHADEKDILQGVCRKLVSHWPYRMAWAGYAETDGTIRVMAAEGEAASFLPEMALRWDGTEDADNPVAACIRGRRPVHAGGVSSAGEYGDVWKDFAVKARISSTFIQPLFVGNRCIGALCMCSGSVDSFTGEVERALLILAAQHVGFALSAQRELVSIKQMRSQMKLAATVFDNALEGIIVTDAQGTIVATNSALTRITGYTQEELIGNTPRILQSGLQDKAFYTAMWQSIAETGKWEGNIWNKRKDGDIYPEILNISTVKDEQEKVQNYIAIFTDISKQKKLEDRLHRMAFHDDLTGLPNRALFKERLGSAITNAHRNRQMLAVLFVDLDRFKLINDTLGHLTGDVLLQEVARRLARSVRENDTVARQGGDEFTIVLQSLSLPEDAIAVVNKIMQTFEAPVAVGERELFTSASIGISFYPGDGDELEMLMKNADTAMYHAKEQGRNGYQLYTACMNNHFHARMALENDLRRALERNELMLFYQPQTELNGGRIAGAEVLLRWQHPERGLVSPDEFIPIAEQSGLIIPIGEWVLREACASMKRWHDAGAPPIRIAVNVSVRQFMQPNLIQMVAAALAGSGLPPQFLELEITESCFMPAFDKKAMGGCADACCSTPSPLLPNGAMETLRTLKGMGVQITVDDFGTGYSNLGYLKKFPLDSLKIDQSFVGNIATDHNDAAIVRAIIAMSASLGLNVIAEGVETEEQRQLLNQYQCSMAQGYLLGRPMPAESFERLLKKVASDNLAAQAGPQWCTAT
ncbi:MAG: EAL domain-containing protein [Pseudomonadota bacterium]